MAHVRKQVRDALKAALTGLPTTGARVFVSRPEARPLQSSELPALLIYMGDESVAPLRPSQAWPQLLRRTLSPLVDLVLAQSAAADDTADQAINEIETALSASESAARLGGLMPEGFLLRGISPMREDAAGETPVHRITLVFQGDTFTAANAPGVAL